MNVRYSCLSWQPIVEWMNRSWIWGTSRLPFTFDNKECPPSCLNHLFIFHSTISKILIRIQIGSFKPLMTHARWRTILVRRRYRYQHELVAPLISRWLTHSTHSSSEVKKQLKKAQRALSCAIFKKALASSISRPQHKHNYYNEQATHTLRLHRYQVPHHPKY